jgi:hypothetical protein
MTLAIILAALCLLAGAAPLAHAHTRDGAAAHTGIDRCEFCLAVLNIHALLKFLRLALFAAVLMYILYPSPRLADRLFPALEAFTLVSLKVRLNP